LRQGDEDGRKRNRGSSAKQAGKAFRPQGVAKGSNMETASPPAMNRNKYSSNGAQPFKLLKAKRLFPYIGSANFLLHRAIIKTLVPLHTEFHQLAAHCHLQYTSSIHPKDGAVHVVIETPRGSRAKFACNTKLEAFTPTKSLLVGLTYPHD
jgi:hypothetical protein